MQDVALDADGDRQRIPGATANGDKQGSSGSSYKTRRRKNGMTIPNNLECLSQPLGSEFGNTAKIKLYGVTG